MAIQVQLGAVPEVNATLGNVTVASGGISTETDPTVPEWAKQPEKPTYTASDVGAIAEQQGTANAGKVLTVGADGVVVPGEAGGASGSGSYELIESFTLTETISIFERTQEPDGTPYSFDRLLVIYRNRRNGAEAYKPIVFKDSNITDGVTVSNATNSSRISVFESYNNHGKCGAEAFWYYPDANAKKTSGSYNPKYIITDFLPISSLTITFGEPVNANAQIEIWGVRA